MLYFFLFVTLVYIFAMIAAYRVSYRLKNAESGQLFRYVSMGGVTSMYITWLIVFVSQAQEIYVPDFSK